MMVDNYVDVEPIYESVPGWKTSTIGITGYDKLPEIARNYLSKIEEWVGTPIDMISTGPDREHTIVLRHPFD